MNKGLTILATGLLAACLVAPDANADPQGTYHFIGQNIATTLKRVGTEISQSVRQDIANTAHAFSPKANAIATRIIIKELAATDIQAKPQVSKGE